MKDYILSEDLSNWLDNKKYQTKEVVIERIIKRAYLKEQMSKELRYHLDKKISLTENVFRYGSDEYFNVINEAREFYRQGFEFDDFRFNKNSFNKTFLRLDFYDNDIGTTQRLLFFNTLFPSIRPVAQPNSVISELPQPNQIQLKFGVGNVLKNRLASSEGYFIYYFKDEIIPTVPKELYMRATLFNAKTGKITGFMSSNDPTIPIDELSKSGSGKLYTKYLLTRESNVGYYYKIDTDYSNNVLENTSQYVVNLQQISVS